MSRKAKLLNKRSLMPPFLVGAPNGRGKGGHGESKPVDNDAFKTAFPNCKHNKWLDDSVKPTTYEDYLKSKGFTNED